MSNNEVEGNGEITCASGMIYKGEWRKSKVVYFRLFFNFYFENILVFMPLTGVFYISFQRHGNGHLFFPNGNEYK
jgi:hypothetical protein